MILPIWPLAERPPIGDRRRGAAGQRKEQQVAAVAPEVSVETATRDSNAKRRIGLLDQVVPMLLETHGSEVCRARPSR